MTFICWFRSSLFNWKRFRRDDTVSALAEGAVGVVATVIFFVGCYFMCIIVKLIGFLSLLEAYGPSLCIKKAQKRHQLTGECCVFDTYYIQGSAACKRTVLFDN